MKLGQVADLLAVKGDTILPTVLDLCSWRGRYEEACLVSACVSHTQTAGELAQTIYTSIEREIPFRGWKGGDYIFTYDTPVHLEKNHGAFNSFAPWMLDFVGLLSERPAIVKDIVCARGKVAAWSPEKKAAASYLNRNNLTYEWYHLD